MCMCSVCSSIQKVCVHAHLHKLQCANSWCWVDATPLRTIPLNKVPPIAYDEPLLKVLDRFQEGRSHIAIVTRVSSKYVLCGFLPIYVLITWIDEQQA